MGDISGPCAPPNLLYVWEYDGYYSPGVCYSGYTIGCTATAGTINHEPVKPSETVAFCVPRYVHSLEASLYSARPEWQHGPSIPENH